MKDKVFTLNMALKYVRSYYIHIRRAKPDYTKMDRAEPNYAEQNQGLHYHTVKWDLHSSEILCSKE